MSQFPNVRPDIDFLHAYHMDSQKAESRATAQDCRSLRCQRHVSCARLKVCLAVAVYVMLH